MKYQNYLLPVTDFICEKLCAKGKDKLALLFRNCFPNTLATTTRVMDDGTTYVFTGDIPAMWLRDSSAQVHQYLPFCADNQPLSDLIAGLIRRQVFYVLKDPYANAYNPEENGAGHTTDRPLQGKWVFERKYEVDSLCYVLQLSELFYEKTGRTDIFDENYRLAANLIADTFISEQHHGLSSPYRFFRDNTVYHDTIHNDGLGAPVAYTGMTWSGFRPSDDACTYGYLIPSNLFAVTVLRKLVPIAKTVLNDGSLAAKAGKLADEIEEGVKKYGIVDHPKYGKMYAYETDGMGNYVFMDDANVPSLIALPYIGYCAPDDEIYLNTRRFLLSEDNPYYFKGKKLAGLGSPHTPKGYVWHIGLTLQGLTATDPAERERMLSMLESSDAGTGYMHEGVNADDPTQYTREWFAWSNSIFSELVLRSLENE